MLITFHKCMHINFYPTYLKDLLTLRSTVYSLRGTEYIHCQCRPASTSYGLHSFNYFACMGILERSPLWLVLNVRVF